MYSMYQEAEKWIRGNSKEDIHIRRLSIFIRSWEYNFSQKLKQKY